MKRVLLLSFLFLFSSCNGEYFDHIRREQSIIFSSSGGVFSGSDIDFRILPDKNVLTQLVSTLDGASTRIWVEIYSWTEKSTLDSILQAKKRGVDVRVILEGNVYGTPWINNDTVEKLKNAYIPVIYADNKRFNFTHIKMWIIDEKWCISTGNWSYTSFTKNRDFILCSDDKRIIKNLEEIFLSDFGFKRPYFPEGIDSRIGLSPENIRPWIYERIKGAKKKIIIYNQTVSDLETLQLLESKSASGIEVEVCHASQNQEDIVESPDSQSDTQIKTLIAEKPYLHAKVFLLDDSHVIVGSANLTKNALDNNREILIDFSENTEIYNKIFSLYHKDCNPPSLK